MYIAYHLLVFDAKQVESNSMEATEPDSMFLYKDVAHSVRTVGEKVLSQVKNIQSKKIIDIVKGSGKNIVFSHIQATHKIQLFKIENLISARSSLTGKFLPGKIS
jgi:hypothetical protein